jgi:uncharacterized protein
VELVHEFTVSVPVERAWEVLTDVQRIAPCMPGAQLTEVDGDKYHGLVKVKVGPITAQYKGIASFVERDEAAHRVVLKANGRDARGQGNASATVTAVMSAEGAATTVSIVTDLSISGRVAQFGRGVMGDVSAKLLEQFVRNLEADVLSSPAGGADSAAGDGGADPAPGAAVDAGEGGTAPAEGASGATALAAAGATTGAGAGAAASGGAASAAAPGGGPAAAPRPAASGEPVRIVSITLKAIASQAGQAIMRLVRRFTARRG